jgi:hypothetical protein
MDENEYRSAYQGLNSVRCVYEKSILTQNCGCRYHEKFNLAEREGIRCTQLECQQNCSDYLNLCRKQARFALHLTEIVGNLLPHSKEVQVQKGGLLGLAPELPNLPDTDIPDIYFLIERALNESGGDLKSYPYEKIIPSISHHPPRPRRSRRHRPKG